MCILNNVKFHLPVLAYVIPCVFSRRNSMKGESNNNTKLIEFCQIYLPVHSSQSSVTERLLFIFS